MVVDPILNRLGSQIRQQPFAIVPTIVGYAAVLAKGLADKDSPAIVDRHDHWISDVWFRRKQGDFPTGRLAKGAHCLCAFVGGGNRGIGGGFAIATFGFRVISQNDSSRACPGENQNGTNAKIGLQHIGFPRGRFLNDSRLPAAQTQRQNRLFPK